jgi:hypothetical protein
VVERVASGSVVGPFFVFCLGLEVFGCRDARHTADVRSCLSANTILWPSRTRAVPNKMIVLNEATVPNEMIVPNEIVLSRRV